MSGWKLVVDEPPERHRWVHVWDQGRLVLAKYDGEGGVHDWLLLPPGKSPVAPYPSHYPRWWMPLVDPPSGYSRADLPLDVKGEAILRWRGSVSDLATDLRGLGLSVEQWRALFEDSPLAQLEAQPPIPSVPMLLWCPGCNERHIDTGEFASKAHHTHACQCCGHVWRPALVATTGVQFLPGFKNEEPGAKSPESAPTDRWGRCKVCRHIVSLQIDHGFGCSERT